MSSEDLLLSKLFDAKTKDEIDAVLAEAPDASKLLESTGSRNKTAPNFFASEGNFDLAMHCVVKHGYNPNTSDKDGRNILFDAVRDGKTGSLSFVKDMIDLYKANVNHEDGFGDSPMHYACMNQSGDVSSVDFIQLLIEKGAKINAVAYNGKTPFLSAVAFAGAGLNAAKFLATNNAAVLDAVDSDGTNALIHSCHGDGRYNVAEWLLSLDKFDVNYANQNGVTALAQLFGFGASKDALQVAELLIAKGAKASVDSKGKTLLHKAAGFGSGKLDLVRFVADKLFENQLNVVDVQGRTPLHEACDFGNGSPRIIEFLVSRGANVNAVDSEGNTPMHILLDNFDSIGSSAGKAASALMKAGADVNIANKAGLTALDQAELSQPDIVDLLKGLVIEEEESDDDEKDWDDDNDPFDMSSDSDNDIDEDALQKLKDFSWD